MKVIVCQNCGNPFLDKFMQGRPPYCNPACERSHKVRESMKRKGK